MEQETKEIIKTETRHDVQIAVIANDMKHISKGIDDMRNDIKSLSNAFLKASDFEAWKAQEYEEFKKKIGVDNENYNKRINAHADILIKHTVSITRIMTYGTAILTLLGLMQVVLSIYNKVN